ncbi:MAG: glycosyltransferase family 2 protein [Smithella sp.]|jgi:dolichol-phosphate mannosyltransferase
MWYKYLEQVSCEKVSHERGVQRKMITTVKKIIIVAPVYNEEANIGEFVHRLALVREPASVVGLLIVDDGSSDQSVTRIEELAGSTNFPILLVRLSRNFGHQNAVLAGIERACIWAAEEGVEWIGLIDADLQDRPEHFANLAQEADGCDVVYAVRKKRRDGLLMKLMAPMFYRILSQGAPFFIPDDAGTFCLMRLPVVVTITKSSDNDPYFPGLRAWVGFRQKGVPVERDQRLAGKSRVGTMGLFSLALRAMLLYSNFPYKIIIFSGGIIFAGSLLVSAVLVVMRLMGIITIPGATTIVVLQVMTLGIQLVFLGLMSHMINRVKENTSRQRSWIVMEERTY